MITGQKKRVEVIIKKINELRNELDHIHDAELSELGAKYEEMDCNERIYTIYDVEQIYNAYVLLDSAAESLNEVGR